MPSTAVVVHVRCAKPAPSTQSTASSSDAATSTAKGQPAHAPANLHPSRYGPGRPGRRTDVRLQRRRQSRRSRRTGQGRCHGPWRPAHRGWCSVSGRRTDGRTDGGRRKGMTGRLPPPQVIRQRRKPCAKLRGGEVALRDATLIVTTGHTNPAADSRATARADAGMGRNSFRRAIR